MSITMHILLSLDYYHPSYSLGRSSKIYQFKMRLRFRRGEISDDDLSAVIITPDTVPKISAQAIYVSENYYCTIFGGTKRQFQGGFRLKIFNTIQPT